MAFRDANMVFWIGKLLYNVPKLRSFLEILLKRRSILKFHPSLDFLFKVRSALHIVSKKKRMTN